MAPEDAGFVHHGLFDSFLKAILTALKNAEIEYMLGSALAVWAYSEPRTPQDIDLVVALPMDKTNSLSEELEKIGITLPPNIILDRLTECNNIAAVSYIIYK